MKGVEEIMPSGMIRSESPMQRQHDPTNTPGFRSCVVNVPRSCNRTQDIDIMPWDHFEASPHAGQPEPMSDSLAQLASAPAGKREKAHAMNRMLCSLLKELDQEFTQKQAGWTSDQIELQSEICRVQQQVAVGQRVIGDALDDNQNLGRSIILRTVFYVWQELLEGKEFLKKANAAASLFQHGHIVHVDRVLREKRDTETYVQLASRLRGDHKKCCDNLTAEKLEFWVQRRNEHTRHLGYMQAVLMQKQKNETDDELSQRLARDKTFDDTYGHGKQPPSGHQIALWRDAYACHYEYPFDESGRLDMYSQKDQNGFLGVVLKGWVMAAKLRKRVDYLFSPERAERLNVMRDKVHVALYCRKVFYGWRVWRLLSMQGCEGLGSAIAVGPNAAYMNKQVGEAWLRHARKHLVVRHLVDERNARANEAMKRKVLMAWATHTQLEINIFAGAEFMRKMKQHSAVMVAIFNAWSRQCWADAVERGVVAKVEASERLAKRQHAVWAVRIAELEGAVRHAKQKLAGKGSGERRRTVSPSKRPFYRPPRNV